MKDWKRWDWWKRRLIALLVITSFVVYYLVTDPDTKLFQNLPFGSGLILTLNIFILTAVAVWVVEVLPDYFLDIVYGRESKLVEIAKQTPQGAGYALIAKSLRILGYCIIIAAAIVSMNIG
jgi:hypothetical protein